MYQRLSVVPSLLLCVVVMAAPQTRTQTWTETQNQTWTETQNQTWTETQNQTWTESQNQTWTESQNQTWTESQNQTQNQTWTVTQNQTWTETQNQTWTETQNQTWTETQNQTQSQTQNQTRMESKNETQTVDCTPGPCRPTREAFDYIEEIKKNEPPVWGSETKLYTPDLENYKKCPEVTMHCVKTELKMLLNEWDIDQNTQRKIVWIINTQLRDKKRNQAFGCENFLSKPAGTFLDNLKSILVQINSRCSDA